MEQEKPSICPLCGVSGTLTCTEHYTDATTGPYDLYICAACDVWFWWPLKNPGGAWYGHDERYADRNKDPILTPNSNHTKILAYLKGKVGRVLDVGCGVGTFLALAKKQGWEGWGIDFDADAIAAGRRTFGLSNLEVNDIVSFSLQHKEPFDVITAFDVFEHIDNHKAFLESVRTLLMPGGYLAMSMPYRYRAAWLMPGDVPPRHLTRWDTSSLKNYLETHGFTVRYMDQGSASIRFIILKLRFKFAKYVSVGLVRKIQDTGRKGEAASSSPSFLVRCAKHMASLKDAILFGIPATLIWLSMLFSRKRYINLYMIAQKT